MNLPFVDNGEVSMERSVAFGINYRWLATCDRYHMACYMQYMTSYMTQLYMTRPGTIKGQAGKSGDKLGKTGTGIEIH